MLKLKLKHTLFTENYERFNWSKFRLKFKALQNYFNLTEYAIMYHKYVKQFLLQEE